MQTTKREWTTIAIPKNLKDRIKKVYVLCGFVSISEYAREALRNAVRHHELGLQIEKERREEE